MDRTFKKGVTYYYKGRQCVFIKQDDTRYLFNLIDGAWLVIDKGKEFLITKYSTR